MTTRAGTPPRALLVDLLISRGELSIFIERPVSAALLAMAVAALVLAVLPAIRQKREQVFVEED